MSGQAQTWPTRRQMLNRSLRIGAGLGIGSSAGLALPAAPETTIATKV